MLFLCLLLHITTTPLFRINTSIAIIIAMYRGNGRRSNTLVSMRAHAHVHHVNANGHVIAEHNVCGRGLSIPDQSGLWYM